MASSALSIRKHMQQFYKMPMQICMCPSVTLQRACCCMVTAHRTVHSKLAWDFFLTRGRQTAGFTPRLRFEAWLCEMNFYEEDHAPNWHEALRDMPFWARQLLAVMFSMAKLQMLIDNDSRSYQTKAIQDQLNMWRV